MTSHERWMPIPSELYYQASDAGRIRSVDRTVPHGRHGETRYRGRIMSVARKRDGRAHVTLSPGHRTRAVAVLVLEAFVGLCPPGLEGCHNNGDAGDDRLSNLRWDTSSANSYDVVRHGNSPQASREKCPRGHPLIAPNLVRSKEIKGHRNCLACCRALSMARYHGDSVDVQARSDVEFGLIMGGKVAGWQSPTCGNGHEMTPENSITRKGRAPECRTCANDGRRRLRAAKTHS